MSCIYWKHVVRAALVWGAFAVAAPALALPTQWTIEKLPLVTNVVAINNSGQVIGGNLTGWLYYQGSTVVIPATVHDINNSGQVIGHQLFGGAVLYENGAVSALPLDSAAAINNSGLIVGNSYLSGNERAVLYDQTGLHELGGTFCEGIVGCQTGATAVNDSGQVVGYGVIGDDYVPLLFEGESFVDLTKQGLALNHIPVSINNDGMILGRSIPDSRLLKEDGTVVYFSDNLAHGMNNSGQVVGSGSDFAWIYDSGQLVDLNTLDILDGEQWELIWAEDINDAGQIIGGGRYNNSFAQFLLTPVVAAVPEPQTYLSMAIGLLLLAGVARRARKANKLIA